MDVSEQIIKVVLDCYKNSSTSGAGSFDGGEARRGIELILKQTTIQKDAIPWDGLERMSSSQWVPLWAKKDVRRILALKEG